MIRLPALYVPGMGPGLYAARRWPVAVHPAIVASALDPEES